MVELLIDALSDSLFVFPFIFLIYVLMELIESAQSKEKIEKALSGVGAPIAAAATGIVPECGFSVMCAKLYDSGLIKIGTLMAAFIATSDEGLVVLMSSGAGAASVVNLILWKFIAAVFFGVLCNIFFKRLDREHFCPADGDCLECGEHQQSRFDRFVAHPYSHAAETFFYILFFNVIINGILYWVGDANVYEFMKGGTYLQPALCALVGLIPNCASSIILAQGYVGGFINFAGLLAGLSSNAGIGLLILYKNKGNLRRNVAITVLLYFAAVATGYLSLAATIL